jgi:hypothetical protein
MRRRRRRKQTGGSEQKPESEAGHHEAEQSQGGQSEARKQSSEHQPPLWLWLVVLGPHQPLQARSGPSLWLPGLAVGGSEQDSRAVAG